MDYSQTAAGLSVAGKRRLGENEDPGQENANAIAEHWPQTSLLKRRRVAILESPPKRPVMMPPSDVKYDDIISIPDTPMKEDPEARSCRSSSSRTQVRSPALWDRPVTTASTYDREKCMVRVGKSVNLKQCNFKRLQGIEVCRLHEKMNNIFPYGRIDEALPEGRSKEVRVQKRLNEGKKNNLRTQRQIHSGLKFHFNAKKSARRDHFSWIGKNIAEGIQIDDEIYCEHDYVLLYLDRKKMGDYMKIPEDTLVARITGFEWRDKDGEYGLLVAPVISMDNFRYFDKLVDGLARGMDKLEDNELIYLPQYATNVPFKCIAGKASVKTNYSDYENAVAAQEYPVYFCVRVFDEVTFDLDLIPDGEDEMEDEDDDLELAQIEKTAMALNAHFKPTQIVGRVKEIEMIENFLHSGLDESKGATSSLYVKGVPGTGKTACVIHVLKKMERQYLYINCAVECITPRDIFRRLHFGLCADAEFCLANHAAEKKLEQHLSQATTPEIVVLDEVDYLLSEKRGRNDVLYKLFDWTHKYPNSLILVVIANTFTIHNQLECRVSSRSRMKNITFFPYTPEEMREIISDRMSDDPERFEFKALKYLTDNANGDLRQANKNCLAVLNGIIWSTDSTAEENESSSPYRQVTMQDVRVHNKKIMESEQCVYRDCLKKLCKGTMTILISLLADLKARNQEATTLFQLQERFAGIAFQRNETGLPNFSYTRFDLDMMAIQGVCDLVEMGVIADPNQEMSRSSEAFRYNGRARFGKYAHQPGASTVLALNKLSHHEISKYLVDVVKDKLAINSLSS